jgi:TolB-like protein/Tfp pilus assembly protein PilF
LSDDKQDAYFADGIQDDILTALTVVADLKVISRSSVMKYRGKTKDLREIGRILEVAHVLEGSVRRAGGRVRVNAQLIDTRDDTHLWAEQYDRDLADVFAIQSEIAEKIVAGLKAKLSGREKAAIEVRPTNDLEAYDLYLRGKGLLNGLYAAKDVRGGLANALELLSEAVQRDRGFALAYTEIARVHLNLYWFWGYAAEDLAQAGVAAQTALRLAPNLGEAHIQQANYYYRQRNYEAALKEFAIAGQLLPNSDVVPDFKAVIARRQGDWTEAIKSERRSIELNPAQKNAYVNLVDTYTMLRDYTEAERVIDQALRKIPEAGDFVRALKADIALAQGDLGRSRALLASAPNAAQAKYSWPNVVFFERNYAEALRLFTILFEEEKDAHYAVTLAFILRQQGDAARAESILLSEREHLQNDKVGPSGEVVLLGSMALVDAELGRKAEALRESQEAVEKLPLERDAVDGFTAAFVQAKVLVAVGERERAIELLSRLATIPGGGLSYGELLLNPRWDGLRGDARFQKIVTSLKPNR